MTSKQSTIEALAFRLDGEEYGIDILKVQEIREHGPLTRVAGAADHVAGVVNLRGMIVPVIDLRQRFGLGRRDSDQLTVVIVLNVGSRVTGMLVDSVSDVIRLAASDIRPAPHLGASAAGEALLGIGTLDGRMVMLLDIGRLLPQELGLAA